MTKRWVARMLPAVAFMFAGTAAAQTTLTQNNANTVAPTASWIGQSVTVSAAGAYNNIVFSWLLPDDSLSAPGRLYLFSSVYNGSPSGLSAAPDVLAAATGSNGRYTFDPSFTLTGGTQYFAYSNVFQQPGATGGPGGGNIDVYTGGSAFYSDGPSSNFQPNAATFDNAFRVTGSATPEPGAWLLMIVGFGMVGAQVRRVRAASRIRLTA